MSSRSSCSGMAATAAISSKRRSSWEESLPATQAALWMKKIQGGATFPATEGLKPPMKPKNYAQIGATPISITWTPHDSQIDRRS